MKEKETDIFAALNQSSGDFKQFAKTVEMLYETYPDYPVLKSFFYKVTRLNLNEKEARNLFENILRHCSEIDSLWGTSLNFFTGMLDYIIERNRIIMNPVFVDLFLSQEREDFKDPLTLAYHHSYLDRLLKAEIGRTSRQSSIFSVMMLDISKFSVINEHYGYRFGNDILIEMADRIKQTIRAEDSLVRYHDDRFVMIMPNTEIEGAKNLVLRILSTVLKKIIQIEGRIFNLAFNIALLEYPKHAKGAETIVALLQKMRYLSKQKGDNYIAIPEE